MRNIVFALFTCALLIFVSCSKENSNVDITGKWNIIYDSSYTGVGLGNHIVEYRGHFGDYFNFSSDNKLYIKEGNSIKTLDYLMVTDSTAIIASFGITVNGIPPNTFIKDFSAHHVTLLTPFFATPGGTFGRSVQLSR